MSDRPKDIASTTPSAATLATIAESERHPTFRHTFLAHLPPDLAEAVEHLGRGLYQLLLALELDGYRGSWTAHRLRAAAADLRYQAAYLAALAQEREASCLSPTDALLSDRAQAWSTQAEALATRIEGALP
jgi:hypothetical protein